MIFAYVSLAVRRSAASLAWLRTRYELCIHRRVFTDDAVDNAQTVNSYYGEPPVNAARRYSPRWTVGVDKWVMSGRRREDLISTSYVERSNLNVRMDCRRFTRSSNGYSKKLAHHEAAVAQFVAAYNR